jgi:hypothetical protein
MSRAHKKMRVAVFAGGLVAVGTMITMALGGCGASHPNHEAAVRGLRLQDLAAAKKRDAGSRGVLVGQRLPNLQCEDDRRSQRAEAPGEHLGPLSANAFEYFSGRVGAVLASNEAKLEAAGAGQATGETRICERLPWAQAAEGAELAWEVARLKEHVELLRAERRQLSSGRYWHLPAGSAKAEILRKVRSAYPDLELYLWSEYSESASQAVQLVFPIVEAEAPSLVLARAEAELARRQFWVKMVQCINALPLARRREEIQLAERAQRSKSASDRGVILERLRIANPVYEWCPYGLRLDLQRFLVDLPGRE